MSPRTPRAALGLVIPTTHWDRDWYWPLERFRVKLVELFQTVKVLWDRHPDYRFAVDGQCAIVEDYLEAAPGDRELFAAMGAAGRLTMGPLYVQSDLYCTGSEAFIRNMLIGAEVSAQFSALQRVVYLPDTFGHTPGLPALIKGFGYTSYAFMRGKPPGFPDDLRFCRWRAADGSTVNVFLLRDGYGNAARLGLHRGTGEIFDKKSSGIRPPFKMDLAVEQFSRAMDKQTDRQGPPHVLIAGVDHQIPQPQLPDIMEACTTREHRFTFADWNDVERAMQRRTERWHTHTGEFHADGASSILGGTVSTRIYLKQQNAVAERLLVQVAEPADALAVLLGVDDPAAGCVPVAWKRLLKAHPHDDITGCSVDTVHRENEMHIACAQQSADAVRRRMAHHLIQHFGGQEPDDSRYAFFVMDTHGQHRQTRCRPKVDFEGRLNWGDIKPPRAYDIVDENGASVPFRELRRERSVEHPHPVVELELAVQAMPFTMQRYFFEARPRWPASKVTDGLENERLRATLNRNGTVDLYDKRTRKRWRNLGLFSDQADCGDEYTFSHIRGDHETVFENVRMKRTRTHGCNGMQVAGFEGTLRIPEESTPEGRSSELSGLPVLVEYSLAPGESVLNCRVAFTNTARDHRLRWNLPTGFLPKQTRAGLKINEAVRACRTPVVNKRGRRIDPEHPTDHFVAVDDGRTGIALFCEFPVNYELVRERRPRLAVALLRAVGFLSRSDMLTRGGGAGPDTRTPDAQCLRSFDMRFAIRPFDVQDEGEGLFDEAMGWRRVPVSEIIMGFQPDRQPVDQGPLIELEGDRVQVCACKRAVTGRGVIVRLFNAHGRKANARLRVAGARRARRVLHDERTKRSDLRISSSGWMRVPIAPWGLETVHVVA